MNEMITKCGGEVVDEFCLAITHVVIDAGFREVEQIPNLTRGRLRADMIAVKPEWVSSCNQNNLILDTKSWLLWPPPPPQLSPSKTTAGVVTLKREMETKRKARGYDSNGSVFSSDEDENGLPSTECVGTYRDGGDKGEMLNVAQAHDPNFPIAVTDRDAFSTDPRQHAMKQHLACQQMSTATFNRNEHITDILERMEQMYAHVDKWKQFGYRQTVGKLKTWPKTIRTERDIKELIKGGILSKSSKILAKIREICKTGVLQQQIGFENNPRIQVLERLGNIHGVGPKIAQEWCAPHPRATCPHKRKLHVPIATVTDNPDRCAQVSEGRPEPGRRHYVWRKRQDKAVTNPGNWAQAL
jgi:hypothetical protein